MAILGIGVDITNVQRFQNWALKPQLQLERVLSKQEIAYCLASPINAAQRFAVRWAAKEALYKALANSKTLNPLPSFWAVCRGVEVRQGDDRNGVGDEAGNSSGSPQIVTQWPDLFMAHLSLSHEREQAVAFIILEQS